MESEPTITPIERREQLIGQLLLTYGECLDDRHYDNGLGATKPAPLRSGAGPEGIRATASEGRVRRALWDIN